MTVQSAEEGTSICTHQSRASFLLTGPALWWCGLVFITRNQEKKTEEKRKGGEKEERRGEKEELKRGEGGEKY